MATPAETPRERVLRARVIWSFWAVIFLLGFPTWWATTSIYRASLPSDLMLASHDDLWYSIPICFESTSVSNDDLVKLAWEAQKLAKGQQYLFKFHILAQKHCPRDHLSTAFTIEPGNGYKIEYAVQNTAFRAQYPEDGLGSLPFHLGRFLQNAFEEEHASVAYQLFMNGKNKDDIQAFIESLPQEIVTEIQKSANRAFKPMSEYHLTFSLFSAGPAPSSWDARAALDTYIQPILHALAPTANFSVASQVQLYSSFSPSVQPEQDESGWKLKREHLTSFVNTAEWPLSPSIGSGPTINFIAYVPAPNHVPLTLADSSGTSWLVPQWGGISILNPPVLAAEESELGRKSLPAHLDQQALIPAFDSFQKQLLQLLGVPRSKELPLQERLKSFQRLAGLSLYIRTSSNLGSLARLAQRLSNIPIPRHVQHYVEHAISQLTTFRQCFDRDATSGTSWLHCLRAAKDGFVDSEKAFFDKSMVGQVYFPDEHKVAVYLPLLGPVGVPLVVGLIRELKSLIAKKKA